MTRLFSLVLFLALVAAACAPTDENSAPLPSDQSMVDAIANGLIFDGNFTGSGSEAECIGQEALSQFGSSRLNDVGVTVSEPGLDTAAFTTDEFATLDEIKVQCRERIANAIDEAAATSNAAVPETRAEDGSEAAAEREASIEQIVLGIMGDSDPLTTNIVEARCMAEQMYDSLGPEQLAGIDEADDVSPEAGVTFIDIMANCMDIRAVFIEALSTPPDPLPKGVAICVSNRLSEADIRAIWSEQIGATDSNTPLSPALEAAMLQALSRCR